MDRTGLTDGPMTSWAHREANIRTWCELQRCDDASIARLLRLTPWQQNLVLSHGTFQKLSVDDRNRVCGSMLISRCTQAFNNQLP
eukprot:16440468-Heterocapsa_arctica.AAC.1